MSLDRKIFSIEDLCQNGSKAMVAMSGGVDSSVAAYLVKKQGFETIGVTMKLFDNEGIGISRDNMCCTLDDVEDARSVANKLDIKYYVFNFEEDFEKEVIQRFIKAYELGHTPNPCIDCNRYIKFKRLFRRGKELEQDYVVTGHYVRTGFDKESGRYLLYKSVDKTKDQSYVLYSMTQEQLKHAMFPLGGMTKDETREIAESEGFINARKRDSQDICFVPDRDYGKFIEEHTGRKYPEGEFVDLQGNVLGRHKGMIRYTIGQRKGLGLALKEPMYVKEKDVEENRVILARDEELYGDSLIVGDCNWISIEAPKSHMDLQVKIRYSQNEAEARVIPLNENQVRLEFKEAQRAITPGQAAVFYDGDLVVGGGTIE